MRLWVLAVGAALAAGAFAGADSQHPSHFAGVYRRDYRYQRGDDYHVVRRR